MDGDATVFVDGSGSEFYRLQAPEYIDEALPGKNGKFVTFVVMKRMGFGSDYAALVRVELQGEGFKVSRQLEAGLKLFGGSRWWLSELGAVSDDGTKVLAQFGVDYAVERGSRMAYKWYTLKLPSGDILSEGLSIANSNTPGKD